jgi:hypothetical protein
MALQNLEFTIGNAEYKVISMPADKGLGMLARLAFIGGEGLLEVLGGFEVTETDEVREDGAVIPKGSTRFNFSKVLTTTSIPAIGGKLLADIAKNDPELTIVKDILLGGVVYRDSIQLTKQNIGEVYSCNYGEMFKAFMEVCQANGFLFGHTGNHISK